MVSPYLLRPLRSFKEAVGAGEAKADARPEATPAVAEHAPPPAAAALHGAAKQARAWPRVVWSNEAPCSGADRPGKD
ncbi:MAG: hypothetical protein V3R79_00955 [Alphaproteobacteria bacterium]